MNGRRLQGTAGGERGRCEIETAIPTHGVSKDLDRKLGGVSCGRRADLGFCRPGAVVDDDEDLREVARLEEGVGVQGDRVILAGREATRRCRADSDRARLRAGKHDPTEQGNRCHRGETLKQGHLPPSQFPPEANASSVYTAMTIPSSESSD